MDDSLIQKLNESIDEAAESTNGDIDEFADALKDAFKSWTDLVGEIPCFPETLLTTRTQKPNAPHALVVVVDLPPTWRTARFCGWPPLLLYLSFAVVGDRRYLAFHHRVPGV